MTASTTTPTAAAITRALTGFGRRVELLPPGGDLGGHIARALARPGLLLPQRPPVPAVTGEQPHPAPPAPADDVLAPGAVYAALLYGAAGPWTIHGSATVLAITDGRVTLRLTDTVHPRLDGHTTYATGTVILLPDGRRQVVNVLTPQPGPSAIGLGRTVRGRLDAEDVAAELATAAAELAPWQPLPDGDGPLEMSALTHLERAVAQAALGDAATAERDRLIQRLRAGHVPRTTLAAATGLDPSRITQIAKRKATAPNALDQGERACHDLATTRVSASG